MRVTPRKLPGNFLSHPFYILFHLSLTIILIILSSPTLRYCT